MAKKEKSVRGGCSPKTEGKINKVEEQSKLDGVMPLLPSSAETEEKEGTNGRLPRVDFIITECRVFYASLTPALSMVFFYSHLFLRFFCFSFVSNGFVMYTLSVLFSFRDTHSTKFPVIIVIYTLI